MTTTQTEPSTRCPHPHWCERKPGHTGPHMSEPRITPDTHTATILRAGYGEFPKVEMVHSGGTVRLDTRNARNLARVMDGMGHPDVATILRETVALIGAEVTK